MVVTQCQPFKDISLSRPYARVCQILAKFDHPGQVPCPIIDLTSEG